MDRILCAKLVDESNLLIKQSSLLWYKSSLSFEAELAQWQSTHLLIHRSPVRFRARSRTGVMDYDEACVIHLIPGVVHNFPKAVGV